MKLSLTPKGYHPDLFELEPTEIRISSKGQPQIEARSSYRSLSATYRVRGNPPVKKAEFVGKLVIFSILPAVFGYYSLEVGWLLALIAIVVATPLFFVIRSAIQKPVSQITFIESADGDFAFYIPYFAEEEAEVLQFTREIQRRIENTKKEA